MKVEEELKFHEASLKTPCLYEINTDNFVEIHMRDTENNERKHSPIKSVITLRRTKISIQDFHHWGRNEVQIHHYLTARKVKMKPHLRMNKYGVTSIKTKMKTFFTNFFMFFIVSLLRLDQQVYVIVQYPFSIKGECWK